MDVKRPLGKPTPPLTQPSKNAATGGQGRTDGREWATGGRQGGDTTERKNMRMDAATLAALGYLRKRTGLNRSAAIRLAVRELALTYGWSE